MQRFDLLEKNEAYQMKLLKYLSEMGGTAKKQEIANNLQVGIYFVSKLVENLIYLSNNSNGEFSIKMNKTAVSLKTKPHYSLNNLFFEFIVQAPKYKILEELFLTGKTDPSRLCEKTNVSYSTYFRKINELNQLLEEFELVIKQGTICGSEFQIRYFFVSLYSMMTPEYLIPSRNLEPRIYKLIRKIKDKIKLPISDLSRQKLAIYCILLKKRYVQKKVKNSTSQQFIYLNKLPPKEQIAFLHHLKNTDFYKSLQQLLFSFLNYYSFEPQADEALLFFLFLISENIIPIGSPILKELQKVEKKSYFISKSLTDEFLLFMEYKYPNKLLKKTEKKDLIHYLKSSIYHHLMFTGKITPYENKSFDKKKNDHLLNNMIDHIKNKYPTLFQTINNDTSFILQLTHAIQYYERAAHLQIHVGILIEDDFLYSQLLTNWWINQVKITNIAHAEKVKHKKFYDVIISNVNYPRVKSKGQYFLFITHQNEKMDLRDLKELLKSIYIS